MSDDVRRVGQVQGIESDGTVSIAKDFWLDAERGSHALIPWEQYERLRADVKFWNETAIEYKRQLNETIRRGPESAGLHIVTTEQINKAWHWHMIGEYSGWCLESLGITSCPDCGGSGIMLLLVHPTKEVECQHCGGHGWVMEDEDAAR